MEDIHYNQEVVLDKLVEDNMVLLVPWELVLRRLVIETTRSLLA